MNRRSLLAALAVAALFLTALPAAAGEPALHGTHGTRRAARPRLLFFMNPNGPPCQLQDRILQEMGKDLTSRADLVLVKTTVPGDLPQFGRYGIRALPTLLVTDADGRELRRATPGIQAADRVRQLLGG